MDSDGNVQRTAVTSGMQLGKQIELLSGPAAGQAVVIKGFLGLAAGMAVQAVGAPQDHGGQ